MGQGILNAGWHAHTFNAPGKFPSLSLSTTPPVCRAYLVTDQDVTEMAARHAASRAQLDVVSGAPIQPASAVGARKASRYTNVITALRNSICPRAGPGLGCLQAVSVDG